MNDVARSENVAAQPHASLRTAARMSLRLAAFRLDEFLLVVRRCVRKRIVEATAIPLRGVHKSVEIFFDIDRLKEQASVTNRLGVFDQNSGGAIDAPHPKSRTLEIRR